MRNTGIVVLASLFAVSLSALAANKVRHPNLVAAYDDCAGALRHISAAQKSNDFDMAGHAKKAKELIEQAQAELKAANEEANENAGKKK